MGAVSLKKRHAFGAWVRRFERTTPGLVVVIAGFVAALCIAAASLVMHKQSKYNAALKRNLGQVYAERNRVLENNEKLKTEQVQKLSGIRREYEQKLHEKDARVNIPRADLLVDRHRDSSHACISSVSKRAIAYSKKGARYINHEGTKITKRTRRIQIFFVSSSSVSCLRG